MYDFTLTLVAAEAEKALAANAELRRSKILEAIRDYYTKCK